MQIDRRTCTVTVSLLMHRNVFPPTPDCTVLINASAASFHAVTIKELEVLFNAVILLQPCIYQTQLGSTRLVAHERASVSCLAYFSGFCFFSERTARINARFRGYLGWPAAYI